MTGPVPGPMPAEELKQMCDITDGDDDVSVYPEVDDKKELKVGDIVFATAKLIKANSDDTADYSLPGIIEAGEGGPLVVRLLPTKLWEQGWMEISTVSVEPASIRYISRTDELDDDQLISSHYEDEIGDVVESCGDKLLRNKSFRLWIGGAVMKDGAPNPSFRLTRWKFVRAVTEKMATSLTINEWRAKGLNADAIERTSDEAKWFETEFLTTVLSDTTSAMASDTEKKKYQADVMPNAPTVMKYVAQMMDILTSDKGPSASPSESDPAPDIKDLVAEVKDLKAIITNLVGTTNAIAAQLNIREIVSGKDGSSEPAAKPTAKPAEPEAEIIPVPGDAHECAYHVMGVAKRLNDGKLPVSGNLDDEGRLLLNDGTLAFNDVDVDNAKETMLIQAKESYEDDETAFEALMGLNIEELYKQVLEPNQDQQTWPTEMHIVLHAKKHPDVELKLKTFRQDKLATISTRSESLPPAKLTVFAKWRPGHFELIGLKGNGSVKFAFTQAEVEAAEPAVDTIMTMDKPKPGVGKLSAAAFRETVRATLAANRAQTDPKPAADKSPTASKPAVIVGILKTPNKVNWAPAVQPALTQAPLAATPAQEMVVKQLQASLQAQQKEMDAQAELAHQAREQMKALQAKLNAQQSGVTASVQTQDAAQHVDQCADPTAAATSASLVSFAQEQVVRQLQADLQAQQKQVQAQAQLSLQARAQVQAMQAKLQTQQAAAQHGPKASVNAPVQAQAASPLDMILNGSAQAAAPGAQPVFIIWSDAAKKRIEQALKTLDVEAFKAVQSISKVDSGTSNAHHVVRALAQNVPAAQQLMTLLIAHGMQAERYDPGSHTAMAATSPGGFQQVKSNKGKSQGGLAGRAQAGLTAAIAKAGPLQAPHTRVRGQCDFYSAGTGKCPRADCRFACYNGPAKQ
jgi:hypothetical protein